MDLNAGALDDGLFIPIQAQPPQALKDVVGEFGLGALPIGVFDAQQKLAALVAGKQPVEDRRTGRADVQGSGGAWRQAHADGRRTRLRCAHQGTLQVEGMKLNGTDGIRTRNFRRDRAVL